LERMVRNIRNHKLLMAVFGSGYVGLPTAALFANAGFRVVAVDVRPEIVESINMGMGSTSEPGLQELVLQNVRAGRLRAILSSTSALTQADVIVVSVQTPIDSAKKPNLSFLMKALEEIGHTIRKKALVVVGSTVPPGTMQGKAKPKLESISSLKTERDFYLAYVPERIAPGKALAEFVESPRLVGGVGPESTRLASELFRTVCKKVVETDAATAEVAKLAENTFRDVNIAFANQLALVCEQLGVDVADVIKLANTHPRVNIHAPGPGVGGPCLPKDPYLLVHSTDRFEHDLIRTARHVNDSMPEHIVKLTLQALKNSGKRIGKARIAVLGTSYKAGVDDSRGSPSKPIINGLIDKGFEVSAYDPESNEAFGARKADSIAKTVEGADCLLIITPHKEFMNLNLGKLKALMNKAIIIDGARVIDPRDAEDQSYSYYGVGFGSN
jgi:UDP-N-acetyl-D-mannosaminuronic acid dehydrogenase